MGVFSVLTEATDALVLTHQAISTHCVLCGQITNSIVTYIVNIIRKQSYILKKVTYLLMG